MQITRVSVLTNQIRTKEIQITEEQFVLWQMGMDIDEVMSNISIADRLFVQHGTTLQEWINADGLQQNVKIHSTN